ncbi:uncharacterized protein BT62DRAFT_936010 [Guyanagaster necrorhizus]|uniref:Uncharacterized protein n=1 Tax=Guyanagaster necrorhizus TaxID=856835 RepID=A0A9P7VLC0_9AGAR|nr:uncharacterized protein BT62DRAFT_936010 [Guyanagaster necrorhizus MCA 3950]KAG7442455.1 hypothetical protein BT62DRAFT_936010 [Guyanagaster necrorhizus MCA 3950]
MEAVVITAGYTHVRHMLTDLTSTGRAHQRDWYSNGIIWSWAALFGGKTLLGSRNVSPPPWSALARILGKILPKLSRRVIQVELESTLEGIA